MEQKHSKRTTVLNSKMDSDMKFKVTEAYKVARTSLSFSLIKSECKKIVFTSSLAGEGKSTTSVNTAISLAQQVNTKVLLIDCDLRKPKVNRFFNMKSTPGLTNCLSGMNKLEEIIKETESPNLQVITSGASVPNPSELLASEQMEAIVEKLEQKYDYIIFDTPPINAVVDALSLLKLIDGFVIVVKEGSSTQPEFKKTVETLGRANAKILGVILNGAHQETKDYYKYHYERYE